MATSLVDLCHHSWALPALGAIGADGGAKLVTIARQLSIAPESARRAVHALIGLDLAMPNPGYGHPMRPEFILAPSGESIGRETVALLCAVSDLSDQVQATVRKKWSIPTLVALSLGVTRFSEIEVALSTATPRAVAMSLNALIQAGLVERVVTEGPPLSTSYSLVGDGVKIARAASKLEAAIR